MKAIKIDPKDKSISEIELRDDYQHLQDFVDGYFECYTLAPGIQLAVNEDAYPERGGFRTDFLPATLTGVGIIFGFDANGDTVDVPWTVDFVEDNIRWLPSI